MSYYRLVISRAFAETKPIWNVHRIWIYFASPLTGFALQMIAEGIKQMGNWHYLLIFAVFGFAVTWLGTYLINLIRVPQIIYREQETRIAELKAIAYPPTPPIEQQRIRILADHLATLREGAKKILAFILVHGSVDGYALQWRDGFEAQDLGDVLAQGREIELVEWSNNHVFIKAEFQFALEHILRSQGFLPK